MVILFATKPYNFSSLVSFKSFSDILVTVKEIACLLPFASLIASHSTGKTDKLWLLLIPSTDESPLGDPKKLVSVLSDTDNVIGIDPSIICSETD